MANFTLQELESMVAVGMGDYKVACGETKLITRDLGSCVGVAIRDPKTNVGGLIHVMLPEFEPNGYEATHYQEVNTAKYADTGLDEMVRILEKRARKGKGLWQKLREGLI